jgi:hypothetical protein
MGIGLGGSTVNSSINLSQRGGAQIELGTDMGSVNYDSSNGSFGFNVNDGAMGLSKSKMANPILSKLGVTLGFNTHTGFSATANLSLTGKDPNHNPKTFGGLSLTVDRTGTNLGFSASGANLLNSHSVNGFSVNENFISDSIKNRILSRANEEFDAEMDRRLKKQDIEFIKNAKPPVVKEGTDLESLKDEVRQALVHKAATNTNDPDNKAKGTSRLSDSDRSYGEIADGFRNLGAAFGLGNSVSGHSGFVDDKGKFHPRTCFTKGTLVTIVKREYPSEKAIGLANRDKSIEIQIPIEEVKIGDVVLSWNQSQNKNEYKKVTDTFTKQATSIYTLTLLDGEKIHTTWNHPFYIIAKLKPKRKTLESNRSVSLLSAIDSKEDVTIETGVWKQAIDLKSGDIALNSFGKALPIQNITVDYKEERVYNFTVEDNHTYYVSKNAILVHNDEPYNKKPKTEILDQPHLSLSQINERYDGFFNFTGLKERISNYRSNRGFVKDYEVDSGAFSIDRTMSTGEEKHLLTTLNSLSSSVRFEKDKDGSLKMIQNNKTKESLPLTKDFLKDLFLDKSFNVNFLGKNKRPKDYTGSKHMKSSYLHEAFKTKKDLDILKGITKDYNVDDTKRQSFITLDPLEDRKVKVWGTKENGESVPIDLPDDITLLHELVHAYRYKYDMQVSPTAYFQIIKFNKKGKPIRDTKTGNFKTVSILQEEAYTIGEGTPIDSDYYRKVLNEKSPNAKYTENRFRIERKLPIRMTHASIK